MLNQETVGCYFMKIYIYVKSNVSNMSQTSWEQSKKNNWKCCGVKDTKILTDVKCQYTRDTAEKQ